MKKILYILSLLSFLLALLVIIVMPLDEIFAVKYWLSIALLLISSLFRIFSISSKTVWIDFIVLITSLILIVIGVNLLSPTTQFLITYGEEFNKIYAGILALFPIIQLLTVFRENHTFPKKIHQKVFILTIIVSLLTLGGIEIYGKTIDLYKLSNTEKIYLYSYNKYTPELIDLALYEIENGSSISKKMALNYINKNDEIIEKNSDVLGNIIFNENTNQNNDEPPEYNMAELEQKLDLMIKSDPEKTLSLVRNYISHDDVNINITIVDALRKIIRVSPELSSESCQIIKEIIDIEIEQGKSLNFADSDVIRLGYRTNHLNGQCGDLGMNSYR